MSATTSIEWTERTWNPLRGCSVVSPGCVNCYAMKTAHRFSGPGKPFEGLTKQTKAGPQWTGVVRTVESALLEPLSWKKPQRIFVNSMSDLFHEDVPDAFVAAVFAVMGATARHTFQVLTKRPERMRRWVEAMRGETAERLFDAAIAAGVDSTNFDNGFPGWPLPNVWLGVSVEDQQRADERIPLLLQTPAAVRFLSCEPLLGPVTLRGPLESCGDCDPCIGRRPDQCAVGAYWLNPLTPPGTGGIDWVIVGGESGPRARPFDVAWARSIVQQCKAAGVACFVKQLGSNPYHPHPGGPIRRTFEDGSTDEQARSIPLVLTNRKGGDPSEWPDDLRVRQFPEAQA